MKKTLFIAFCLLLIGGCTPTKEEKVNDKEPVEEPTEKVDEVVEEEDSTEIEQEEIEEAKEDEEKPEEVAEEKIPLGDYEVFLGGEMIEEDDKIIINGKSNLLPGARVVGSVSVGDDEYYADTSELIQEDGSFHMEIKHHDLNKESNVAVRFHFDGPQDAGITRHYGDRGQKLEGVYIYKHQGEVGGGKPQNIFKQAMVTATFDPSEDKAIRQFNEPTWYPIPDDMGDPRVWIEVDEINNDEEYFYIHGHSNIIEGSKLFLDYYSKRDETLVLPDGSFNFKFPYEYRENTPFKIQLVPNHYTQWNIVSETYGERGQKLVGELVQKEKYSDKLYAEKVVEQESTMINVPDNVELKIEGSEVTMLVPDNVLFDFDKFDLKESSKETLKEISKSLESSFNKKDLDIVIHGHTDNVGNKAYNLELSEKRANEVKKYLESLLPSSEVIFTTKGHGDAKPIATNDNESGQAKNRRVEIVINLK
jgi:outer membrane protein OmpA-like peptidoglycan-associated protein